MNLMSVSPPPFCQGCGGSRGEGELRSLLQFGEDFPNGLDGDGEAYAFGGAALRTPKGVGNDSGNLSVG